MPNVIVHTNSTYSIRVVWHCALFLILILIALVLPRQVIAHGGVAFGEEDMCLMTVGFLKAHFTIYQPKTRDRDEFCEDIPDVTESIFVMEYLHDYMREMPIDFRIIRDATELGYFARWEDVEALGDLSPHTVFYQGPAVRPEGVYSINHVFAKSGVYIGIVTAKDPGKNKIYRAVFPFQVGTTNVGYLPLFVLLLILAQVGYWWFSRRGSRAARTNSASIDS